MTSLLVVACTALSIALLSALLTLRRVQQSIPSQIAEAVDATRKDFKKRSARTRVGLTVEQWVPFFEEFPYDPSDARILSGGPVDYIVFDGLTDGKVKELVFLDVKTGKARTNHAQKQVEECASRGQVRFTVFEVGESGAVAQPRMRIDELLQLSEDDHTLLRHPDDQP